MKKSEVKKNNGFGSIIALVFLFIFCSLGQAQNNGIVQSGNKKYVRIDIGHGAMHCPFLSPKLEEKLKSISGIENFFIDKENSYATFSLPGDTEMTVESLKKIGTDVGYPTDDVFVKLDSKPIVIISNK